MTLPLTTLAHLSERLQELHARTRETPLFNPVFQLGLDLSRSLEGGVMDLDALEQLVEEATTALPHALIGEAVDVIVFMSRASGARRVEQALRITGFDGTEYRTEPLAAPFLNIVN